jgi:hypothetical protein
MKVKKEYLVLLTVIIILALYLALRPTGNNLGGLPQPAALDSAALNRLVITDKEDTALELVKKDARWFIEPHGYLGDTAKVKNMLKAISDLTLTALVSESGNYERYGLAPNEKKSVQALSNGDTLRAFDIGRTAPTQQHTFVLLAGDPNVYHARGQIARTFDHTVEGLRDKTVFDFDKADVTAITLQQGGRSMTLTQQAHAEPGEATEPRDPDRTALTEWRDAAGRTVDQDAVNRLIDGMARMDCDAYMDDQASERLSDARWTVTFETPEGNFTLMVFDRENGEDPDIPALASSNPYAFFLNADRVERFEASLNALLDNGNLE